MLRFYAASGKKQVGNGVEEKPFSNLIKDSSPEIRKVETDIHPISDIQGRGSGSSNTNKKTFKILLYLSPLIAATLIYQVGILLLINN